MKKLFAILSVLAISLSLAACQGTDKEDVLKVGMECAYAPFNWTQTDGTNNAVQIGNNSYAGGYDVSIAQKIADELGMKLEIVKTEWDGLLPAVTSGKIDLIVAGMSPTAERKETIDFSDNYYTSDLVIVVKKDGKFASATSLTDFKDAKITAQLSTFHYDVLDQITGVDKQTAMEDFPAMIVALQSGKIDGYISEKPGAIAAATANSDLTYIEFGAGKGFTYDENEVSIAVGMKKGSELMDKVNAALKKITQEQREQLMKDAIKNQPLEQ